MTTTSTGAYAPDKALAHRHQLEVLRTGGQPNPVHLHLILSDLCDLNCHGCAYRSEGYSSNERFFVLNENGSHNNNPNRQLDTMLVKNVLSEFREMGGRAVELTGGGEPTLHPAANHILWHAHQRGLDTALVTNGLRLHKAVLPEEIRKLSWLRLSIDAATPATYGKVRQGLGGAHGENIYKVLDALYRARHICDGAAGEGASATVIGAGFVVQKENWREIYDAVRMYRDAGAHNVRISGLFTVEKDRYFDGWRYPAEEEERRAVDDFNGRDGFRVYSRFHEKVEDTQAAPDYSNCAYENFTTYLAGDGNLYRCCVTSYNKHGLIGNVAEAGGFRALWESDQKKRAFSSFDARSCTMCQFNDRNRSINAAIEAPELPDAPADLVHTNFV